jgi:uncharacterized protein YebE (UPF0316 family)
MLFFVGIIEMIVITSWTKLVSKTQVISSGIVTFINILIWYYVLERVVNDIHNISVVLLYAFGCALGNVLTTLYFQYKERPVEKEDEEVVSIETPLNHVNSEI